MEEKKEFYLIVRGEKVMVSEEVYRARSVGERGTNRLLVWDINTKCRRFRQHVRSRERQSISVQGVTIHTALTRTTLRGTPTQVRLSNLRPVRKRVCGETPAKSVETFPKSRSHPGGIAIELQMFIRRAVRQAAPINVRPAETDTFKSLTISMTKWRITSNTCSSSTAPICIGCCSPRRGFGVSQSA